METRVRTVEITEYKVYYLVLNTFGAAEDGEVVAAGFDLSEIQKFYHDELLPKDQRFRDEAHFFHSFREGPLFNYNPCGPIEPGYLSVFGHGLHEDWFTDTIVRNIRSNYRWIYSNDDSNFPW